MEGGILTALSVISTVCAIVFGYVAFVRNRDQDKTKEAKSDATILRSWDISKAVSTT